MNFPKPLNEWKTYKDCGNKVCTGLYNVILNFEDTNWRWDKGDPLLLDNPIDFSGKYQLVPINNDMNYDTEYGCKEVSIWNAFFCESRKFSLLVFTNMDQYANDKALQPVYVKQENLQGVNTNQQNELNAFMDHGVDGLGYTSQKRTPSFPAIVYSDGIITHEILTTGSAPENMTFELMSEESAGVIVKMRFDDKVSRIVKVNKKVVIAEPWDETTSLPEPVKTTKCGSNRYEGVKQTLEFYIDNDLCSIEIATKQIISCMVRMQWTLTEFFADGGTTNFVDRLAGTLGIHASQIKTVSVYEGSLVLNYEISPAEGTTDPVAQAAELKKISESQIEKMATGKMNLGAPILDSSIGDSAVVTNGVVVQPGFDPIVLTPTDTNTQGSTSTSSTGTTTSGSTTSSSSSSAASTSSTYKADVKTGTHKAYSKYVSNDAENHFENMKFAKEKKEQQSKTSAGGKTVSA